MKMETSGPRFLWRDLSDDGKNLLERLLGLHDDRPRQVTFEIGKLPVGASKDPWGPIVVTADHLDEIKRFVEANRADYAVAEFTDTACVLKLKKGF
jgi:hypothetical protein